MILTLADDTLFINKATIKGNIGSGVVGGMGTRSCPGNVQIGGDVTITDNKKVTSDDDENPIAAISGNVNLGSQIKLTLTNNLTGKIGITSCGECGTPAKGGVFGIANNEITGAGNFVADSNTSGAEDLFGSISDDGKLVWTTEKPKRSVTFNTNGLGRASWTIYVKDGEKVEKPSDLTESGYTFDGWYADQAYEKLFDFATPIMKDTTVYAKWTKQSSGGSSKHSQGSSVWLTAAPTPTPVPTETPAAVGTPEIPTVKPTGTPTETPKSPVPFAGILAGLGAAAALFAVRRK